MWARPTMVTRNSTATASTALQSLAHEIGEDMAKQKGFQRVIFFRDPHTGEGGAISLWAEEQDARDAHGKYVAGHHEKFSQHVTGKPTSWVYEVIKEVSA